MCCKRKRFKVFQKKTLGRKFGPKREELIEGWKKLHGKELCNYTLRQML
jgi:hypothetical protein